MFDPSSSYFKFSSFFLVFLVMMFFAGSRKIKINFNWLFMTLSRVMKKETDFNIKIKKGNSLLTLSILFFILFLNVLALFPQNFANTSQLTVTLFLALCF